jgi:hypothetical protein
MTIEISSVRSKGSEYHLSAVVDSILGRDYASISGISLLRNWEI